jgi:hypothetical protein
MLDLAKWPERSRVFIRRERPHPGAQLRFTDADGHRFTAFIADTDGGQFADLEVRHRAHARVEDRIRGGKTTGLRNFPCRGYQENKAWLELALTAADLHPSLVLHRRPPRAEPATLRYRVCAIAGKLTRTARVTALHLDRDWPWAQHLATAFTRLRTAPWPG